MTAHTATDLAIRITTAVRPLRSGPLQRARPRRPITTSSAPPRRPLTSMLGVILAVMLAGMLAGIAAPTSAAQPEAQKPEAQKPKAQKPEVQQHGPLARARLHQEPAGVEALISLPRAQKAQPRAKGFSRWTSYPIFRGETISVAVDPVDHQVFYVGTRDAGVFKSVDSGQTWRPARSGLTFYPIRSLAVDPLSPATVYAGTDYDGIWRSDDGGATWSRASDGLDLDLIVTTLVADPSTPGRVLAGMAGGLGLTVGQIFLTTDHGATWSIHDAGIPRQSGSLINGVRSLAIDPEDPDRLAAGTTYAGVFYSSDGGVLWSARNTGIPGDPGYFERVGAVAFSPHETNASGDARLCGIIWDMDVGYACLDDTSTWVGISQQYEITSADHLLYHPSDADVLVASGGLSGQCKISYDGGVTWESSLAHPQSGSVAEAVFHPSIPTTIVAAADVTLSSEVGGVYRTTNLGASWSLSTSGVTAATIRSVAIDPTNPQIILAGTGTGGLQRSADSGATWQSAYEVGDPDSVTFGFEVSAIVLDPADPSTVVMAAGDLYTSTDGGVSFARAPSVSYAQCLAVASGSGGTTLWIGASFGGGVLKGDIDGPWVEMSTGLPTFGNELCPILALAVDPGDPDTVWAGTQYGGGIARTTDGGVSWQVMGLTSENFVQAIAVSPADSNLVLAGAGYSTGTIYRSTNGGATWQAQLTGVALPQAFLFDPADPTIVYAATEGSGLLRSRDAGLTWEDHSTGIFYPVLYSLALDPGPVPLLLTGSYGSGLYWRREPGADLIFGDDLERGDLSAWSQVLK